MAVRMLSKSSRPGPLLLWLIGTCNVLETRTIAVGVIVSRIHTPRRQVLSKVSRRAQMDIRKLREADAEVFWNFRLRALRDNPESFGASYEEILERGIAGVAQGLRKRDTAPDDATFGAFEGTTLIGIAGFRREVEVKRRHKGIIWGMYVPQEMRGKGIGKALLLAAIAYAKTLPGLEKINLSVVL